MFLFLKKAPKFLLGIVLIFAIFFTFIIHILGNFYHVADGVYRSGQLNKYNLDYYVQKHGIKSIINLRGESANDYYMDEVKVAQEHDVKIIDYPLTNSKFLDFDKTSEIVKMLRDTKKPLLIHCAGGADRTSLLAALYQFAVAKISIDEAKEEFSFIYGHIPSIRQHVIAMDNSFDNYVNMVSKNSDKIRR